MSEKFGSNSLADEEWIPALAEEDWIIFTKDLNIRRNRGEERAWRKAGLIIFFFQSKWMQKKMEEQAQKFWELWGRIRELSEEETAKRQRGERIAVGFEVPFAGPKKIRRRW